MYNFLLIIMRDMIRPITARLTATRSFQSAPYTSTISHQTDSDVSPSADSEKITSHLKLVDTYRTEAKDPMGNIATPDTWSSRSTLRFGEARQFGVTAAMSCPSPISNTAVSSSATEIGNEIFAYLKSNDRDLVGTDQVADEAVAYGKNKDLACVFESRAMTEILDNKNSYATFDDLFSAISQRKLELVSCLSWGQKLKYAMSIKGLLDRIEVKKPILENACRIYARHLGIKVGSAGADLIAYFFRPDRLTPQSRSIFDRVFALLNAEVARRYR